MLEADDVLRGFERPEDANRPVVFDWEVERKAEGGALGPDGSNHDTEIGGGGRAGEGDEGADGEDEEASIQTLSSSIRPSEARVPSTKSTLELATLTASAAPPSTPSTHPHPPPLPRRALVPGTENDVVEALFPPLSNAFDVPISAQARATQATSKRNPI